MLPWALVSSQAIVAAPDHSPVTTLHTHLGTGPNFQGRGTQGQAGRSLIISSITFVFLFVHSRNIHKCVRSLQLCVWLLVDGFTERLR